MSSPSMVHRSGDTLVVRSVVSGDQLYQDDPVDADAQAAAGGVSSEEFAASLMLLDQGGGAGVGGEDDDDLDLPQCKIKRNYACTHCDFFSQNPRSYLYHLKDVHKQKIKVYECPSCLYASKHSQKLQRHVHMVHVMNKRGNNKKLAAAATARKKPSRRPPLMVTLPRRRDVDAAAAPVAVTVKTEPGLGLKSIVTVVEAGPPAIPGELLTCTVCGFATRNANAMARHEKLVHLKKRFFRCTKCNYVTHMRARYTKHVKYHSMPMIKCDLCDFRTPYKWNLDRHYKNHQGDGAYKCSICNFTADIKQSLTVHEMNHHVPPVGQVSGASVGRRRNKVGASDSMQTAEVEIDQEEMELLRMERENDEDAEQGDSAATATSGSATATQGFFQLTSPQSSKPSPNRAARTPRLRANIKKLAAAQRALDTDFVHPADGNVYLKALRLRCSLCPFTAAWPGAMEQHQRTAHAQGSAKKPARPIPNLIPIGGNGGGKSPPPGAAGGTPAVLPILRIPLVLRRVDKPMTAQDLDDICAQSCANSSLRDFASLMGGDVFDAPAAQSTPTETVVRVKSEPRSEDEDEPADDAAPSSPSPTETPTTTTTVSPEAAKTSATPATSTPTPGALQGFKKKNASFFDKLKEKLLVGSGAAGGEACDLTCWCGHESKCLSEQMRHQKLHAASARDGARGKSSGGGTILTAGAELSSTRCQHCRQRCKTSADLVNHLQSCADAKRALNATPASVTTPAATPSTATTPASGSLKSEDDDNDDDDEDVDVEDYDKKDGEETEDVAMEANSPEPVAGESGPHPMENKVFVWTSLPAAGEGAAGAEADCEEDCLQGAVSSPAASDGSLVGVETAPGYGAVTGSTAGDAAASADGKPVKKVFKCPHCTFWASTASRFHVHIVGHLNKKPFECSLCAYRSNWRWDITKHIRLKSARDVNHETAGVLMTDETGRRNYSKYNKYLTLMRVHEPSAESSGSGRRTKPGSDTQSPSKLPPPPLLRRAPSPSSARNPPAPGPLRPPPALRPAASRLRAAAVGLRRPSGAADARKTLWKCKKCNFRDARRELVLAHVKEHYQQREAASHGRSTPPAAPPTTSGGSSEASEGRGHAAFRCGHCQQVSNWKHVIQRHCRLKHSGDVKVVRGPGIRSTVDDGSVEETSQTGSTDAGGLRQCEICPFACLSAGEMSRHNEHHSSWPGASYRCTFCLYFVSHKRDLVSHLRLHGVADPEGHLAQQRQVRASGSQGEDGTGSPRDSAEEPADELGVGGAATKRYRCAGCPYVSNSKSQFLYHKQFHRPRGAPFKCVRCSYNVSRRHLLHQHMRVHGVVVTPVKNAAAPATPVKGDPDLDDIDQIEEVSLPSPRTSRSGSDTSRAAAALDTRALPDIPLVWVSRGTKFFKMYKCRFCPHVNVRKANITEHEKMHSARAAKMVPAVTSPPHDGSDAKREPGTQPTQHRCPDCNYVCNNAGVLSSHAKVHQGIYGEVRCLFDATRSDESQLQELADSESPPAAPAPASTPTAAPAPFPAPATTEPPASAKRLVFCAHCPARFLFTRELTIHARFHDAALSHRCESCSYAARQRPHLMAHLKVHSEEYQRRTEEISAMYPTSPLHPRPRAVLVDRDGGNGATWVVIGGAQPSPLPRPAPYRADKHHECQLCPASFFKSVALQYHITLHGGAGPHRCRHCDYAVKTYGNLVKHEMIHGSAGSRRPRVRPSQAQPMPVDGAELFRHREQMQAQGQAGESAPMAGAPLHVDPQFGTLMHGNPQYTYPTYLKNGRLKEKRYKCHKCPSAFEKREQYKVHLSLHGSKQRYRCEKCDYSVKYYANYIQHTRKHSTGDVSRRTSAEDSDAPTSPEPAANDQQTPQRSAKSLCPARGNGPITLSVADRQSLLLQQLKRSAAAGAAGVAAEEPRSFGCPHCPYASVRRDGVESHVRRHVAVSGVRGAFLCDHCDYSVPHQHFLREHNKVHFGAAKRSPPEAFMRCSRMELFLAPDKENVVVPGDRTLVFADAGVAAAARFLPPLPPQPSVEATDAAAQRKVFVNELTGEPVDVAVDNVKVEAVSDNDEDEVPTDGGSQDE